METSEHRLTGMAPQYLHTNDAHVLLKHVYISFLSYYTV